MQSQSKAEVKPVLFSLAFPNLGLPQAIEVMSRLSMERHPARSRLVKFEYVPGEEVQLGRSSTLYCFLELALVDGSMDEEERLGLQHIIEGRNYVSLRLNDIEGYERYGGRN